MTKPRFEISYERSAELRKLLTAYLSMQSSTADGRRDALIDPHGLYSEYILEFPADGEYPAYTAEIFPFGGWMFLRDE